MSQYKYAEIGDTVYFWFAANETDGDAGDGADPIYDVRLAGAASDAAPTASGSATLLSHANYGAGLHEIAIDSTGYSAGEYAVFCTITISTVNPGGFVGSFKLRTAGTGALKVDTVAVSGDTTAADTLELFVEALDQATGQLDSGTLHDDTITAASINTGAFTADAFAADAIVAATLATGAITADAFAADAIVAATLATGALTADAFAADALVAATFATDCITTDALANGTITADKLGADCITAAKIADDALANEHFADGALTSTEITSAGGCVVASIANDAITAAAIAAGAIDNATFAADVGSTAYATNIIALAAKKAVDQYDPPTNAEMEARTFAAAIVAKLTASAGTIVTGEAAAGTLSTTEMTTNLTVATDDHYNGRIIIWTSGVLQNQATDITDYDGATKKLTFTAVTNAPTAADTFVIV